MIKWKIIYIPHKKKTTRSILLGVAACAHAPLCVSDAITVQYHTRSAFVSRISTPQPCSAWALAHWWCPRRYTLPQHASQLFRSQKRQIAVIYLSIYTFCFTWATKKDPAPFESWACSWRRSSIAWTTKRPSSPSSDLPVAVPVAVAIGIGGSRQL